MYRNVASIVRDWVGRHGYAGLFGLLLLGIAGLPLPDETLLALAGYMAFSGRLRLAPTMLVAFAGSYGGISLSYGIGRTAGVALLRRLGPALGLTPARIARAQSWFDRLGRWALTFGFFLPGVRQLGALLAGGTRMRAGLFAVFAGLGALLWSQSYVLAGYLFGESWKRVAQPARRSLLVGSAVLLGSALAVLLLSRRGRRQRDDRRS